MKILLNSLDDTKRLAKNVAKILKPSDVIAYEGGMGVGKTTFTRLLLHEMGYDGEVTSPTFSLIHEYKLKNDTVVCHFDMYRITDEEELYFLGFFDYLKKDDTIMIIEWSENIKYVLPKNTVTFSFRQVSDTQREVEIMGGDKRFEDISTRYN